MEILEKQDIGKIRRGARKFWKAEHWNKSGDTRTGHSGHPGINKKRDTAKNRPQIRSHTSPWKICLSFYLV